MGVSRKSGWQNTGSGGLVRVLGTGVQVDDEERWEHTGGKCWKGRERHKRLKQDYVTFEMRNNTLFPF